MHNSFLPVTTNPPGSESTRGDAARNRERVLSIAQEMISSGGVACLTMDALAERAGVGKGTIFRRFGSRSGLLEALLSHTEADFQREIIFGAAPLGPGVPPGERLKAFGEAILDRHDVVGELQRAARTDSDSRFDAAPVRFLHQHVRILLDEVFSSGKEGEPAGASEIPNTSLLASALLSSLEPGLIEVQREVRGFTAEQQKQCWSYLVDSVIVPRWAPAREVFAKKSSRNHK